jgi:hypothetical protein
MQVTITENLDGMGWLFQVEREPQIAGIRIDWVGLEIESKSGDAGCTNLYMVEPDEILERRSCMTFDEKLG